MKHPLQQLTPSTGSSVKYVSPFCAVFTHDSYAHVLTLLNFSIPVRFLPTDTSNCPPPCPHPMARRGCTTGTPTPGHFSAVAADGRHSFARTSDGLRDPCRRTSKRFTMTKVNSGSHYVTCAWKSSKRLWPSRYTAMHRQMIAKPVLQGCMLQTIREPCGFDMVQKNYPRSTGCQVLMFPFTLLYVAAVMLKQSAMLPDMLLAMLNNLQIGVVQPDIPTMHVALQTAVLHSLHNLSACTTLSENGPRNIFSHVVTLSDLYHGAEKRSIPDVKLCCCCCRDVFCVLLCVVIVLKLCCCCCLMFVVCFLSLLL